MSTEKIMKEFIEAFVEQYGFGRMSASSNPDAAAMLACAEWAWFKSRAAIEVELPEVQQYDDHWTGDVECFEKAELISAIESLGLKIKQ